MPTNASLLLIMIDLHRDYVTLAPRVAVSRDAHAWREFSMTPNQFFMIGYATSACSARGSVARQGHQCARRAHLPDHVVWCVRSWVDCFLREITEVVHA